jgi:hypothetical protein
MATIKLAQGTKPFNNRAQLPDQSAMSDEF